MNDADVGEARPLHDALADFSGAIEALQHTVGALSARVGVDDVPCMSGDELEAAWWELREKYERVADAYPELAESAEDAMDHADALEAREESRREGGTAISHEELKAKLGFE